MFKGVATKITLLAIDTSTNTPKTGDAANLTAYIKKDGGTVTVLADTSATEDSATNAPGLYTFDVSAAETTADWLEFSGKSSTTSVRLIPKTVFTSAGGASFTAADVWAAATRTLTGGAAIITGDIEFTAKQIVRGNDYSSANQPWAESMSSSSITDLSAYAWVFTADKDADNLETGDATFAGTVVVTTATGSSRALRIDVAASLTDSLAKGYYNGAIRGTATSGSKLATPKFISVKVVDDPNQ